MILMMTTSHDMSDVPCVCAGTSMNPKTGMVPGFGDE